MAHLFFKILRGDDWTHFGYQYKLGLNEYKGPFTDSSTKDGFFFCLMNDIPEWLQLYDDISTITHVDLCPDSRVQRFKNRLKTDKFILRDPIPVQDFCDTYFSPYYLTYFNPLNLKFCKNQNRFMADDAIERNVHTYAFTEYRTFELLNKHISENGFNIKYTKYPMPEVFDTAVRQNGLALAYVPVKYRTYERCKLAVQQTGLALAFVPEQTEELCEIACKQNGYAIQYVKKQTAFIVFYACSQNKHVADLCDPVIFHRLYGRDAKGTRYLKLCYRPSSIE
jgi:hypothetical protein